MGSKLIPPHVIPVWSEKGKSGKTNEKFCWALWTSAWTSKWSTKVLVTLAAWLLWLVSGRLAGACAAGWSSQVEVLLDLDELLLECEWETEFLVPRQKSTVILQRIRG